MDLKGFKILNYQDCEEDLLKYREKGALRGVYLGFPYLHQNYTMSLPGVTDWTGFPASGKSEILLEMLLNTSEYHGWRHLLFVPDVGEKNEVLGILIHKRTGKTFDKRFENVNYISENEVRNNLQWILHHFQIIVQTDLKAKMTPYQFWDYAAMLKVHFKGDLHTATIDSWKDMRHNIAPDGTSFNRDDKYLEDVLSYRNSMAEHHKMHFHTVIHPVKTEADKDGNRKAPTPYDLKGGSEWYNNGKCMITVHRISGSANEVEVIVTKAKPKSVAKVGKVTMYFNLSKNKFYYIDENNNSVYSSKEVTEIKAVTIDEDEDELPF
jgi:hypothetical protein